jgi:hypothetical protein
MEKIKNRTDLGALASWQLIPIFLWGAISLYWMPIGIHWKWVSLGFLFSFAILIFYLARRKEEDIEEIALPSAPEITPFEKENQALHDQIAEKTHLLASLQEDKKKIEEASLLLVEEHNHSLAEKNQEIHRLTTLLAHQEALLLENEKTLTEWQNKTLDLQQKADDLHLELQTLLATDDSKEEKELFFFFSEDEAFQFLTKKQKEALPFLNHSLSALQGWVENEKEGFLLLFSSQEKLMLASNLPLFPLFTRNKDSWILEDKENTAIHKIPHGDTIFLFKKADPSKPLDPVWLATAFHSLSDLTI